MSRGYRGSRSFYNAGGKSDPGKESDWAPRVDKNPFYRTMDIFNGVFKKNIKLSAGKTNCTDMHTIYVNFGELTPSRLKSEVKPGKDSEHTIYMLECGHEWDGKNTTTDKQTKVVRSKVLGQDWGMCGICGSEQIYRGFEHEWQHIIFKSDLAARKIFVDQYSDQLLKQAPGTDIDDLRKFLHLLVNAFDDIRVNSLWEKVYAGSAYAIWDRWRWFTLRMEDQVNTSFLSFIFAVAFQLPTDPQGEFAPMRPVIEWAVDKVKYRGFPNMLIDIKVVLDRCMGTLLAGMQQQPPPPAPNLPPPPPQQAQPQQGGNGGDQQEEDGKPEPGDPQSQGSGSPSTQAASGGQEGPPNQEVEEEGGSAARGSSAESKRETVKQLPSAKSLQATEDQRSKALQRLMQDPVALDPKEEHSDPTAEDLDAASKSQATKAMMAKVLNQDVSDIDALDHGDIDNDMKQQLEKLQNGIASKSESSQLTGGAKARVTIIEVTTDGKPSGAPIELDEEERLMTQRMRAAFYRTMGKQKAKRSPQGNQVDVQSLIQYRGDHQDPNVFENEDINQGFAYSVLCDMSGSMQGTFPQVCQAVEMLKQALRFPFVVGNLWGFRGGSTIQGRRDNPDGEVWMYRYGKNVKWYTGTTPHRIHPGFNGVVDVPVACGGITPMNSAINVASAHLWRKMPSGMSKRMFVLTDGAPMQVKVSGHQLPEFLLRQFVAKEVRDARKHGIQVYTIVIGENAIDEEKCLQMFGPRKFWRRVGTNRVGTELSKMVLSNFSKYIRARG